MIEARSFLRELDEAVLRGSEVLSVTQAGGGGSLGRTTPPSPVPRAIARPRGCFSNKFRYPREGAELLQLVRNRTRLLKRYFSVHRLTASFLAWPQKKPKPTVFRYAGALHHCLSRKTGEAGHPRHQRSRRREDPDRGGHSARHQGRAACDPRQRQDALKVWLPRSAVIRTTQKAKQSSSTRSSGAIQHVRQQTDLDRRTRQLLKRRFEAGSSCRQIADDIGVSRNAVIGKLSRLNLTREKARDARRPAPKRRCARDTVLTARRAKAALPDAAGAVRRAAASSR